MRIKPPQVGDPKSNLTYKNVPQDINKWVKADCFLPASYDLVLLKVKRNNIKHTFTGWWNGGAFDGREVKDGDKVIYWKRIVEK